MATIATTIKMYDGVSSIMKSMQSALEKTVTSFENIKVASDGAIELNKITKAVEKYDELSSKVDNNSNSFIKAKNKVYDFSEKVKNSISHLSNFKKVLKSIAEKIDFQEIMDKTDEFATQQYQIEVLVGKVNADAVRQSIENSANAARVSFDSMLDIWADMSKLDVMGGNYNTALEFSELMTKAFKTTPDANVGSMMDNLIEVLNSAQVEIDDIRGLIDDNLFNQINWGDLFEGNGNANTSDFVNVMLNNKKIVEKAYSDVPVLFSEIKQSLADTFNGAFGPIMSKISEIVNNPGFKKLIEIIAMVLDKIISLAMRVVNIVSSIFSKIDFKSILDSGIEAIANLIVMFNEAKGIIIPIILGILAAILVYNAAAIASFIASTAAMVADIAVKIWHAAVSAAQKVAIIALTIAQLGLNAAIAMCPLTWIIMLVIALVVVIAIIIVQIVKWIKKMGGLTNVINIATAYIRIAWHKMAIAVLEVVKAVIEFCKELDLKIYDMACSIVGWILDMALKVVEGFEKMVNKAIDIINWFIDQLQKLPFFSWVKNLDHVELSDPVGEWVEQQKEAMKQGGEDIAAAYDSALGKVDAAIAKQEEKLAEAQADLGVAMTIANEAKAAEEAEKDSLKDKIIGALTGLIPETPETPEDTLVSKLETDTEDEEIKENTGRGADAAQAQKDSMDQSVEELKYLRDLAEQEAINRFTTAEIKIEMNNENNINGETDIDGIVSALSEQVEQAMVSSANGVYV